MSVETSEDVKQFLTLSSKSDVELRAICEGLGLSTEGNHQELVDRITGIKARQQNDVLQAQAIPLRCRTDAGETIESAAKTLKEWRRLLFNGENNIKEFALLSSSGKVYKTKMKYILCSDRALQAILQRGWYYEHSCQKELLKALTEHPDHFNVCIVQKQTPNGSWVMLHCEPRKAA